MNNMKKLLCLLLALLMLCTVAWAEEDEGTREAVTAPAIENPQDVLLDVVNLYINLPADWTQAETPENYIAVYRSADETCTLSVLLGQSLSACHALIVEQEEAGTAANVAEKTINDLYYLTYQSTDGLYAFAYLPITESNCIIFCCALPEAGASPDLFHQILGSLHR